MKTKIPQIQEAKQTLSRINKEYYKMEYPNENV